MSAFCLCNKNCIEESEEEVTGANQVTLIVPAAACVLSLHAKLIQTAEDENATAPDSKPRTWPACKLVAFSFVWAQCWPVWFSPKKARA